MAAGGPLPPPPVRSPPTMSPNGQPNMMPSMQAPQSLGPPGSLTPGTLVRVGPYTVTVKRYLSQGGFATVYLCLTDRPLAIPSEGGQSRNETTHVLKRIVVPDKETLAEVRREVEVHKLLRHDPSVVHFLEASALSLPAPQTGYEVYILMEYCAGGGLLDLLNSRLRNRLSELEALQIFADVCKGVAAMHHLDPPVAHRDLKIENILLAPGPSRMIYKLCDFGSAKPILSRRAPRSMEELRRLEMDLNKATTLPYRPPEMVDVYQRKAIDEKADIWALGVLLYKLCYYTTPFEENGGGPLAILNVKYRFPSNPPYSDRIKGLIAALLVGPSDQRPSIDQLLINVHKLLNTRPPSSAIHYAQLAAGGKQLQALPRLVDGAGSSGPRRAVDDEMLVRISKSRSEAAHLRPGTSGTLSGQSTPSGAVSSADGSARRLAGMSKDDSSDLISFRQPAQAPSALEESERLMKAEGVTPMRRGRPNPTNGRSASPKKNLGKMDLDRLGMLPSSSSSSSSLGPSSPSVKSPVPIVKTSVPPAAARTGNLLEGFDDSFEPSAPMKEPPVAGSTSQGTLQLPTDQASSLDKGRGSPASPISPVNHSPTLPGLATSPLPPPTPVESTKASQDDGASGRFPSLEELDRRFPEPPKIASKPASIRSRADAGAGAASGLKNRQSVSDIANKWGSKTSENASSSPSKPMPSLPPRRPMPKEWLSPTGATSSSKGPHSPSSARHRFEANEASSVSYRSPSRYGAEPSVSPTISKTEEESLGKAPSPQPAQEKEQDTGAESSDDDEGPESAEGLATKTARQETFVVPSAETQPVSEPPTSTLPEPRRPGKIQAPDWLQRDHLEEERRKRETPRVPSKPLIDFEAKSRESSTADESPAVEQAAKSSPSPSPRPTPATAATSRAPAFDWDADEPEMRALPLPSRSGQISAESTGRMQSRLVDVEAPSTSPSIEPQRNYLEERGASGDDGKSAEKDLEPPSDLDQMTILPADDGRQGSADTTRSATSGLPSRIRQEIGGKVYSDAATSPAPRSQVTSPEPLPPSSQRETFPASPQQTHKHYAAGTAASMASRWEGMKHIGPAGQPMKSTSSGLTAPKPKEVRNSYSSAVPPAKMVISPAPPFANGEPTIIRPMPSVARKHMSFNPSAGGPRPTSSMKPWEREAAEREEAERNGVIRSGKRSDSATPEVGEEAEATEELRDGDDDDEDTGPISASPRRPGMNTLGGGVGGGAGRVSQRHSSVASLIDRWQTNTQSDRPESGWGQIGSKKERLPGQDV